MNQKIVFPGHEGAPFRGQQVPNLKSEDQLVEVWDARVEIFDLSQPEHMEEYRRICDNIAKGWYILSYEKQEFIPDKRTWLVLIRYIERYAEQPGYLEERIYHNGRGIKAT